MDELNCDVNLPKEGSMGFPVAPKAWYECAVIGAEKKEVKSKERVYYLNTQIQILSGEWAGTTFFQMFNLWSDSDQAQEIAKRQFAHLRNACGLSSIKNFTELYGRSFRGSVGMKPEKDGYKAANYLIDCEPANVKNSSQLSGKQTQTIAKDVKKATEAPLNIDTDELPGDWGTSDDDKPAA